MLIIFYKTHIKSLKNTILSTVSLYISVVYSIRLSNQQSGKHNNYGLYKKFPFLMRLKVDRNLINDYEDLWFRAIFLKLNLCRFAFKRIDLIIDEAYIKKGRKL